MCNFVYQQQRVILSLSFQKYPRDLGDKEHLSTPWVDSPQDTFCNAVYSIKRPSQGKTRTGGFKRERSYQKFSKILSKF